MAGEEYRKGLGEIMGTRKHYFEENRNMSMFTCKVHILPSVINKGNFPKHDVTQTALIIHYSCNRCSYENMTTTV